MDFSKKYIKHSTDKAYLISKTEGPYFEVRNHQGRESVCKTYLVTEGWVPKSACTENTTSISVPEKYCPKQIEKIVS